MNYKFDSGFVDANDTVMRVRCETKDDGFYVLIDTWNDPYDVYYNCNKPEDEETFRKELFDYLVKKYPDYF